MFLLPKLSSWVKVALFTRSTNWNWFLLDGLDERETLYMINFTNICQKSFLYLKWTKLNTKISETITKMEFSSLMDHPLIFTQICPKLPLYTKWAKVEPILETSTFSIPKWWNQPFCSFTQINPKLSSISKWEKLKLTKWVKSKPIFEKNILEIS